MSEQFAHSYNDRLTDNAVDASNNEAASSSRGLFLLQETEKLRGVAHIAGAAIEWTYERPEHITDEIPLIGLHGFGGVKSSYREFRTQVAQRGKGAITYRPARSRGYVGDVDPGNISNPGKLLSQAAWAVMRDVKATTGDTRFDASGHSMGGFTLTQLAKHKPEYLRTAIYVGSVGLDDHTVPQMLGRALRFVNTELRPSGLIFGNDGRVALEGLHYMLRNPVRTVGEGLNAAGCSLKKDIPLIRAAGIKTGAIQFNKDTFFPTDRVTEESAHLFDHYQVLDNPNANHIAPQVLASEVAEAHIQMLKKLHPEY